MEAPDGESLVISVLVISVLVTSVLISETALFSSIYGAKCFAIPVDNIVLTLVLISCSSFVRLA